MTRNLLLTCIALFTMLAACRAGPTQDAVAALAEELKTTFPNEIEDTDWENAPPMDPPLIYIDFRAGLPDADLLTLLCEEIKPRVLAVHPDIAVLAGGWTLDESCP